MNTKIKSEVTASDEEAMAALLDDNLEDVPDLPEFGTPPKGTYRLLHKGYETKKINDKLATECRFSIVETIELANENDTPPKAGMEFSELVWFHNDPMKAKGVLKRQVNNLTGEFGTTNLAELMAKVKDMEVIAVVNTRRDKEDKERFYASVEILRLA